MTKRVMSDFSEEAKITENRRLVAFQSPNIREALDDWDRLSEKDLMDGLQEIEEYVQVVKTSKR